MTLEIGDANSIKARDAGRLEAWKEHFEEKFADNIECPDDCHEPDACKGPEVYSLAAVGIRWECRKQGQTCGECGQDIERDHFWTDFEGKSIGFPAEPGVFDPNEVKG